MSEQDVFFESADGTLSVPLGGGGLLTSVCSPVTGKQYSGSIPLDAATAWARGTARRLRALAAGTVLGGSHAR